MSRKTALSQDIYQHLQEIYETALLDGNYTSALKALDLQIKIIPLLESSTPNSVSIHELDDETIQKMIEEMKRNNPK